MASSEWVKFNEDSKAKNNREKYVANHGGEFVKSGRKWLWHGEVKPAPQPKANTTKEKTKKKV